MADVEKSFNDGEGKPSPKLPPRSHAARKRFLQKNPSFRKAWEESSNSMKIEIVGGEGSGIKGEEESSTMVPKSRKRKVIGFDSKSLSIHSDNGASNSHEARDKLAAAGITDRLEGLRNLHHFKSDQAVGPSNGLEGKWREKVRGLNSEHRAYRRSKANGDIIREGQDLAKLIAKYGHYITQDNLEEISGLLDEAYNQYNVASRYHDEKGRKINSQAREKACIRLEEIAGELQQTRSDLELWLRMQRKEESRQIFQDIFEGFDPPERPAQSFIKQSMARWRRIAAEHYGRGVTDKELEDFLDTVDKKVQDLLKDTNIWMRIQPEVLDVLLFEDGEEACIKTQFETHTSGAVLDPNFRANAENVFFGYPKNWDPKKRIRYAYATNDPDGKINIDGEDDPLEQYGPIAIRFKPVIELYSTITMDDSLKHTDGKRVLSVRPTPFTEPTRDCIPYKKLTQIPGTSTYFIGDNNQNPLKLEGPHQIKPYIEVQIHKGDLTRKYMAEVVFTNPMDDDWLKRRVARLQKLGIPSYASRNPTSPPKE